MFPPLGAHLANELIYFLGIRGRWEKWTLCLPELAYGRDGCNRGTALASYLQDPEQAIHSGPTHHMSISKTYISSRRTALQNNGYRWHRYFHNNLEGEVQMETILGLLRISPRDTAAQGVPTQALHHPPPSLPTLALSALWEGLGTCVVDTPAYMSRLLGFGDDLLMCSSLLRRADPEKGWMHILEGGSGLFGQEVLGVLSRRECWGLGIWWAYLFGSEGEQPPMEGQRGAF